MEEMTKDITKMWGKFTLMEVKTWGVNMDIQTTTPVVNRGSYCIVGKLLVERTMSKEVIKTPLIRAWHPMGWVSFKELGTNLFLIDSKNQGDKDRVLEGHPWTFGGDLVSIVDFDGVTPPSQLDFDKAAFWVRMYDLPLACMSIKAGNQIGATVGKVEEVDVNEEGVGWGKYLRVKILLDLTKPLSRGRMLRLRGNKTWVAFLYEKILGFCFKCGTIRHGRNVCVKGGGRQLQGVDAEFEPWLRVFSPKK
jgi:hypothetical protein